MIRACLFFIVILCGCNSRESKTLPPATAMEIGDYILDLPADFRMIRDMSSSSLRGVLQGDSLRIFFDYGTHVDQFSQTPSEYINSRQWATNLGYRFMKEGVAYTEKTIPRVEVISVRPAVAADSVYGPGIDYMAVCRHADSLYNYPVYLPASIKSLSFSIDSLNGRYKKTVVPADPKSGVTGLYIHDKASYDSAAGRFRGLSLSAPQLSKQQQEEVLRIFETVRPKEKK
jgi:hypothetical protein